MGPSVITRAVSAAAATNVRKLTATLTVGDPPLADDASASSHERKAEDGEDLDHAASRPSGNAVDPE